jgi:hypothetical protein
MSAYIAARKDDRVTILSDAATYDRKLIVRRIASKIEEIGQFNTVVVSRGDLDVCVTLANGIRQIWRLADSFDIAVSSLERQLDRLNAIGDQRPLEFILAGISEAHGPVLRAFTNRKVEGMEPFKFHIINDVIQCGFVPTGDRVTAFDEKGGIDDLGLDMMELMRLQVSEPLTADSKPGHIVGGFVERADITADGISREIIRRWPDRVGFPIDPAAAEIAA